MVMLLAATVVAPASTAGTAVAQSSITPRCAARHLRLAARYEKCLFETTATPPAFAKCNGRLATAWAHTAATCPTGDVIRLRDAVGAHRTTIAEALGGAPLRACDDRLDECAAELASCRAGCTPPTAGALLATNQVSCWDGTGALVPCGGTGQDGELQFGLPRTYTDNGDGTIGDPQTGLTWEKLSDDDTIHDRDTTYTWSDAFTRISDLNASGFAGHNDWRLPNVVELASIVSYARTNPAILPAFIVPDCIPGCTILTCSCTRAGAYWTSTTSQQPGFQTVAWTVDFFNGGWSRGGKSGMGYVRAVRGGAGVP